MAKTDKDRLHLLEKLLQTSPTAWHLCDAATEILEACGFVELQESSRWELEPGGKYFFLRNGSSLLAFIVPDEPITATKIVGSHSDSPGFKVKPLPDKQEENLSLIGLEMYGGPLISSWLNRDCKIAGRLIVESKKGKKSQILVNLEEMLVTIPQLAIHLDKGVNDQGPKIDKQKHLYALAGCQEKSKKTGSLLIDILQKIAKPHTLLAYDLLLAPTEKPGYLGKNKELLAAYRLDNLSSFHASLAALLHNDDPSSSTMKMLVCWDNEEIGSQTAQGAASPMVLHTIERIFLSLEQDREDFLASLVESMCLSIDVSHAWHPGYPDRYEPDHKPLLGGGVTVKINANQKYASESESIADIVSLCAKAKLNLQKVINRGNIAGGSTIGPHFTTTTTIPTVDIGVPLLSMHSAREMIHLQDQLDLTTLLDRFLCQ